MEVKLIYGNWEDFFNNKICSNDFAIKRWELLSNQISEENRTLVNTGSVGNAFDI